jgi:cytochrome c peroxidase
VFMTTMIAKLRLLMLVLVLLVLTGLIVTACRLWPRPTWSEDEIAQLRSLWIGNLPPLPPDPTNRYGNDPRAAALGHKLFFDTRLSANGAVACGTCHLPDQLFQDAKPLATGVGTTNRRTMTIIGAAYSPWLFWDGRKDNLWAQALGPLESPVEHGGNRTQYTHLIDRYYRSEYETLFGPLPALAHLPASAGPVADATAHAAWERMSPAERDMVNQVYANLGKAIAAYERLIQPGPARFDTYVEAVLQNDQKRMAKILTPDEVAGLRLFIGEANCTRCHNGPLFTDNHLHNTGVPPALNLPEDTGRALGAQQVQADEFNCLSPYSDAKPEECAELRFMTTTGEELVRAFKPPSLRNVVERGPYMHAGQITTLAEVVAHYNSAPAAPAGHSELEPLNLSAEAQQQIIAFLATLDGPLAAEPQWLKAPSE